MPAVIGAAVVGQVLSVAGLTALGETAILGTTLGALASNVVGYALVGGAMLGAQALLSPRVASQAGRMPGPQVPQEVEGQPVPPRFWTVGRDRVGGKLLCDEWPGNSKYYAYVVNCWKIGGVVAHIIDDEALNIAYGPALEPVLGAFGYYPNERDWTGEPIVHFTSGTKNGQYIAFVYTQTGPQPYVTAVGSFGFVEFRNASNDGHVSTLLTTYAPEVWTTQHRAKGLAVCYSKWTTMMPQYHMIHYPGYVPKHSAIIDGGLLYDPRDPDQDFADPDTWTCTANGALAIARLLTFEDAFALGYDDIDWPAFAAAADRCDELAPIHGGGFEPWGHVSLTWDATQEKRDVLADLKAAIDADVWTGPDGRITIQINDWEEPTITLDARDIAEVSEANRTPALYDANSITARYKEPRRNYAQAEAPVVEDEDSIARVGARPANLDLRAVSSFNHAFRLAARHLARINSPSKITATGGPSMKLADGERVVRVSLPALEIDGVYRVVAMEMAPDMTQISATLHLVTPAMFEDAVPDRDAINPSLAFATVTPPYQPPRPDAPTLSSSVVSGAARILGVAHWGGASAPPNDSSSSTRFQSRKVDPGTHVPLGDGSWTIWTDNIGQYSATSPAITGTNGVAQCVEVQCWLIAAAGNPGEFSPSAFTTLTAYN